MATEAVTALDDQIREHEAACYAHYGVSRTEDRVVVDSDLGRFAVRLQIFGERGSAPPVVLLHGVGSMQVLAAPLLPYLSDRQVIAVDWPGHGLSQGCILPSGTDLRAFAVSVMDSLFDELGIHRVDLVGHSLGAQFSVYTALDLAPQVRRVALLGAPGAAFGGARPAHLMKVMALPGIGARVLATKLTDRAFVRTNEEFALGAGAFRDVPKEMVTAGRLISCRPGNPESIASYFRTLIRGNRIRSGVVVSLEELSRLPQPTMLAWGDDDIFNTPSAAAAWIVAIRDCRLVRFPNTGHAPWLQNPKAVGSAVAEHLDV